MKIKSRKDETGLDSVAPESLRDATHFRRIIARKGLESADKGLRDAVAAARAAGDSWTVVGAALGTTKQAGFKRFAKGDSDQSPAGFVWGRSDAPLSPQVTGQRPRW
jgi:hypothetical protein